VIDLGRWTAFYSFVGATAAALLGLIFIAVTLAAGFGAAGTHQNRKTFILPIIRNLAIVVIIACIAIAPIEDMRFFGGTLALLGLFGIAQARVMWRRVQAHHLPATLEREHWLWHLWVAGALSGFTVATGILLIAGWRPALYLAGLVTVFLILVSLRDTWRVLEYIIDPEVRSAATGQKLP
jgi:hypothetical protein